MLLPTTSVEFIFSDESNSTAVVQMYVPASTTVAEIDAISTGMASILASMTDAVLIGLRYRWRTAIGDAGVAGEGSAIVNAGTFIFHDVDGNTAGLIIIPAILSDLILATGNGAGVLIDIGDTLVNEFIDEIVSIPACNPFGVLFSDLETAYRQSRV